MKKILMIGNHEIVIYNFRRELIERMISEGYEVYVSLPYGEKVENLKKIGCKFIDTPINRRNTNPLEDFKLILKYIKILDEIKPDVVLTYTIKPNVYGGIACRYKRIPYICNVTGLGSGYINGGLVQKIVKNLSKISFKKAKKVFFQNTTDMNLLISQNIVKGNSELLPGSGVNLDMYKVLPYPLDNEITTFNFIARIMKDKGIEEYLEVAKRIKQKYSNIKFNVIGMIDQIQYEGVLKKYQEEGVIEYLGFKEDMIPYIKSCSCIVNSSYSEGMSNVLLEGAACGRPIIASDIPGCREIVEEGINGFKFEVKNIDNMYEKIDKFIKLSRKDKVQMGLNGRSKVEKEFDRQIVVNAYINEIKNLIK
ncbi:glycosyl transferase [[Clostridium] sordellii]|uniref:glycosyltransferase family 4 protein n=1 Tax=Paraclostridium sordellii TaxID=1505 RepID=UPI0005E77294|nr:MULTISPECIES: glycosyltransferase family 4 protein [Paeniclostridium]MBW4862840.1 glycosyltransferase family 4 protein [Paeniclostridium sp.]MBW4873102.1 glycosyltransferase family 4 protein [Paeniclostridium sp.]CEN23770.1 glycosyl transferase [[Clostridium] sordellii] [Paeniclostridium sordellii]